MMESPKFCKDCRYCPTDTPKANTVCQHPSAGQPSSLYWVTGNPEDMADNYHCISMRRGICANGLLWEPR